jgi:hypothetical protein
MLPNERFALACRAYYEEQGLIVDETNGEFAHCPYPEGMGETGYYLLHGHHQHQGLLQSQDLDKCCFFIGHAKKWLNDLDYFPDNFFDLWDIYEKYAYKQQSDAGKMGSAKNHKTKDVHGKSMFAVKIGAASMKEKGEDGKSVHAVRMGKKAAEKLHAERDEQGKSVLAMKNNSQVWESTVDGFRSNAGAVAGHNKARGWDPAARVRIS